MEKVRLDLTRDDVELLYISVYTHIVTLQKRKDLESRRIVKRFQALQAELLKQAGSAES
jgi:hypothetical protein